MRVPRMLVLLCGLLWMLPTTAFAQAKTQSIHVLEIDSDDAEDQAEALTGALRSRTRSAPGWVLLDTSQSLSMLTAALRCPPRPDAACLQRIAEQLKADRFMWGLMNKSAPHQVTAEVHLWSRGKPDQVIKESYSDNLKDQGDDTLRRIAGRIFDRLTGTSTATIVVHAGTDGGAVTVDGEARGQLDHGTASLTVTPGAHVVEVRATGYTAARQSVTVAAAGSTDVTLALTAESGPAPPPSSGPSTPFPGRKVAEWTLVGAGVVLLAIGTVMGVSYLKENSDMNNKLATIPANHSACDGGFPDVCNYYHDHDGTAKTDSLLFYTLGGAGAVATVAGIYLIVTDKKAPSEETPNAPPQVRLVPRLSPVGGGLDLRGTF